MGYTSSEIASKLGVNRSRINKTISQVGMTPKRYKYGSNKPIGVYSDYQVEIIKRKLEFGK